MFQAHVPEQIIQERTGHYSLAALRTYEHTTEEQHRVVSTILSSSSHRSYEQTIQNINQSKVDLNLQPNTSQVSGMHLYFQNMTGSTFCIYQTPVPVAPGPVQKLTDTMHSQHDNYLENDLELLIRDLESGYFVYLCIYTCTETLVYMIMLNVYLNLCKT